METGGDIGLKYKCISHYFKFRIDEHVRKYGVTGVQLGIILRLLQMEDQGIPEIHQKDLEKAVNVTHPTMTEIIKKLEAKGLVECRKSEADGRAKAIFSTGKARDMASEIPAVGNMVFAELTEGIPEDEVETMRKVIDLMMNKIKSTKERN